MDQYRWPLCPAQRGRISIPAQAPGSSWLPKRCLTWEGGFQGSKSFWQQTLCFQTGEDVPAFQRTECSGKPGWGGRLHPDVLCDREGTGPGCGRPHGPRSLVLQIVLERLRQGQGADGLQALAAQGQADAPPAQVHQRQGPGCRERGGLEPCASLSSPLSHPPHAQSRLPAPGLPFRALSSSEKLSLVTLGETEGLE